MQEGETADEQAVPAQVEGGSMRKQEPLPCRCGGEPIEEAGSFVCSNVYCPASCGSNQIIITYSGRVNNWNRMVRGTKVHTQPNKRRRLYRPDPSITKADRIGPVRAKRALYLVPILCACLLCGCGTMRSRIEKGVRDMTKIVTEAVTEQVRSEVPEWVGPAVSSVLVAIASGLGIWVNEKRKGKV